MAENTRRAAKPSKGFYRTSKDNFFFSGHFNKNDEMRWVMKKFEEGPKLSGWKLVGSGTITGVSSYSAFSHIAEKAEEIVNSFIADIAKEN